MGKRTLGIVLLAALNLGACTVGGTGPGDGTGDGPLTREAAIRQMAGAWCDHLVMCGDGTVDRGECLAEQLDEVCGVGECPGLVTDPTLVAACLEDVAALSCDGEAPASCHHAFY